MGGQISSTNREGVVGPGGGSPAEVEPSGLYCPHGILRGQCADCAYVAALERGHPSAVLQADATGVTDRAPRQNVSEEAEPVEADTHVLRPDLDAANGTEGAYVIVRAGDVVPAELRDFPRRPAEGESKAPKRRR